MKLCFNQATTMKHATLETDLELCEKHGYDLIEIRLDKLRDYLTRNTLSDLKRFFDTHHLKPFAFNALEWFTFRTGKDAEDIWEKFTFMVDCGDAIGCRRMVVVPTFNISRDLSVTEIHDESVKSLRRLADYAAGHGMSLAFEFCGYPNCSVNTFSQAYRIVADTQRDNVGLVLDCFHFYSMGSRPEDILKADAKKIFILHIDDSEDLPTGAAQDDKRLWPGDGVVPLTQILANLKAIGYKDMVSVELFRPEYWDMDMDDCIRVAKEKTLAAIDGHFSAWEA